MAFPTYTQNVLVEGHEHVHHFLAKEDVTQGQVVVLDTDDSGRSVEPVASAGTGKTYGVALYTASSGDQVAVAGPGAIVRAVSDSGSISSGDFVVGTNNTNEGEVTGASSGDRLVGMALEDDTGSNEEATLVMQVIAGQFGD